MVGRISVPTFAQDRRLLAVEKRAQLGEPRVKSEGQADAWRCDGKQVALGDREVGANFRVVGVVGRVERNDKIVGVISAEQENADQSFVVRRCLRHGVDQSEAAEIGGCHSGGCCAAGVSQEITA